MNKPTGKSLLEAFLNDPVKPALPTGVAVTVGQSPVFHGPQVTVPVPARMAHLKRDDRGYLVPFFVSWIDGQPEFRCVAPGTVSRCIREKLCWVCGQPHETGPDKSYLQTYVIGPMCAVNRISAEPGSHLECAHYSVKVCPFLSAPRMRRNEKDLPANAQEPGGLFIKRNPGAILLWTTAKYQLVYSGGSEPLFRIGDPTAVEFWREGRHATRVEVLESIRTGLPILTTEAKAQGPDALAQLDRMVVKALDLLIRFTS